MGLLNWLGFDGACEKDPIALDDKNFDVEVMKADLPVMIDVWAPSCGPCAALVPTIRRLTCKYEGQIKVCHLNAGVAPKTMAKLGVRGTPTVLFLKKGRIVERVVGLRGEHYYDEIINEELLPKPPAGSAGTGQ